MLATTLAKRSAAPRSSSLRPSRSAVSATSPAPGWSRPTSATHSSRTNAAATPPTAAALAAGVASGPATTTPAPARQQAASTTAACQWSTSTTATRSPCSTPSSSTSRLATLPTQLSKVLNDSSTRSPRPSSYQVRKGLSP